MEAEKQIHIEQTHSKPANILAKQIVINCFQGQDENCLKQSFMELNQRKNHSHQKFSVNLANQLYMFNFSKNRVQKLNKQMQAETQRIFCMQRNINIIFKLQKIMECVGNSQFHIKSIINGFIKFWFSVTKGYNVNNKAPKKSINEPVDLSDTQQKKMICYEMYMQLKLAYFNFNQGMCESIIKFIIELQRKINEQVKQQTRSYFIEQIQQRIHPSVAMHCCYLIHYMNLHCLVSHRVIPLIIVNTNIQKSYIALAIYPQLEPCNQLIDQVVAKLFEIKKSIDAVADIKKMINLLNLDPNNLPLYIKEVNKKCLRHFLSTQDIFFTELKIQDRRDLLQSLVEILIQRQRRQQAVHFINKYHLNRFYDYRGDSTKYMKNILICKDAFKPTQDILKNPQGSRQYLTLQHFGYKQNDIIFINRQNIRKFYRHLQNIRDSARIGIDTQSLPIFNAHQIRQTALLQLAIKSHVYLFDILSLKKQIIFGKWLMWLLKQSRAKMIGIGVQKQLCQLFQQIMTSLKYQDIILQQKITTNDPKILQQINSMNLQDSSNFTGKIDAVDISAFYKRKNPKDPKSSLQHMCNVLFKMKLSKYEQCSGWQARPLRRSQIHYAAMDAVLPISIYDKLRV